MPAELAYNHLDLGFDLCEGGFGLCKEWLAWGCLVDRARAHLLIVDGSA